MGVVGGNNHPPSSGYDIYATAPLGYDLSGSSITSGGISSSVSDLTSIPFPTASSGVGDSTKSWSAFVDKLAAGSFYGDSGIDPDSAIGSSGIINEGLWEATPTSNYTYLGYFTLDTTGGSPSLSFTSIQAVPEPASASVLGGGALLLWVFRNRFGCKNT
jgi:hypothetical protein